MPNQNNIKVSIAMATFNGGRYLQEQLDSLAKQTVLPFELVVCDDGSTDATRDILAEFSKTSPFKVTIYHNPRRLGHHQNFLKAATLCRGDWIAYCDQDDYWLNNKIERVADAIAEWPDSNLIVHVARIVDENLRTLGNRRWPRIDKLEVREPLTGTCISFIQNSGHACIFKAWLIRDLHQRACGAENRFPVCDTVSHDAWINLLAHTFGSVIYIPDELVLHRRHHNALTGSGLDTGLGSSMRTAFRIGAAQYRRQAENVTGYASFLADLAADENFQWRDQAERGRQHYANVGRVLGLRADLYDGGLRDRIRALVCLMRMNAYPRGRFGYGLGSRAFVKDLVCAFLGPLLKTEKENRSESAAT